MKPRTKLLLSLALASVAIAGCSALENLLGSGAGGAGAGTKSLCPGTACQVFVNVTDTSSGCTISDPGSLLVKNKQRVLITWHLPGGMDFTADGITFKSGVGSVFSGNQRTQKGVYQVWDDYSNPANQGTFRYRIKVTTDTGHACEIDPDVVNG